MKYSGLYFISNPTAQVAGSEALCQSMSASIERNFERCNREDGSWNLSHIMFRQTQDTPQNQNPYRPSPHSYHHLLRLSYLNPSRAYSFIQQPPSFHPAPLQPAPSKDETPSSEIAAAVQFARSLAQPAQGPIVSLPTEQFETVYNLILNQWTQLWTPQRALDIPPNFPGFTYTVPNFTLRIGGLRARRSGPQTAATLSPGILVCITTNAGALDDDDDNENDHVEDKHARTDGNDDGDDVDMLKDTSATGGLEDELDFTFAQERIRGVWKTLTKGVELGKSEIREVMQAPQVQGFGKDKGKEKGTEAVVRMWCEALKLRG